MAIRIGASIVRAHAHVRTEIRRGTETRSRAIYRKDKKRHEGGELPAALPVPGGAGPRSPSVVTAFLLYL
jgi:hypothetical protein